MARFNFMRLAVAVGIVGLISSQIPMTNGVAMADDSYNLGNGDSARALIQAGIIAIFGLGVADGIDSKQGTAAAPAPIGAAPPATNSQKTIYDVTGADPDLSDFYKGETAIQNSNELLGTTLSSEVLRAADHNTVKYTVFAPTDTAFSALNSGSIADLLNPKNASMNAAQTNDTTASLFSYHIIPNQVLSINDLKRLPGATAIPGASLTTLDGTPLYILYTPGPTPSDLGVLQVSNAPFGSTGGSVSIVTTIRQTDEVASDGVVHPIDAVLIPSSLATTPLHVGAAPVSTPPAPATP